MVLWKMTYYIDKDKLEEYRKFAQEVSIPYWTSIPGMTEMRAYVQNGSTQLLVEMEFESGEAWGKAWDDPKTKEMRARALIQVNQLDVGRVSSHSLSAY